MNHFFNHYKIYILFLALLCCYDVSSQVGITNSGMTQEQERNQASKGFDNSSKSTSALKQLENMTGQTVTTYSSQRYNQSNVSKPSMSFDQQMNIMVTGMIAQSLLSSLFNSSSSVPRVQEVKTQTATLVGNSYLENLKIQQALITSKHFKMMNLYKTLSDEKQMKFKSIIDLSMQMNPYQTFEEAERQKLLKKGKSITWDFNNWAQHSNDQPTIEKSTFQRTKADEYLDEAINKIETLPGGVGRIPAVAGRFMVNIKDETMSYLNDAIDAAISGNTATMSEVGNADLGKRVNNAIYKTGVQTASAYYNQGKDMATGYFDDKMKEVNFGIVRDAGGVLLEKYKIYAPISDSWKVSIRKH
jgi:hypothetical protein